MTSVAEPTGVSSLGEQLSGPLFLPEASGWDDEVACFNAAIAHRPAVAVGATSADDVQAAVRFAVAAGLPIAVQATGHAALTAFDGGVLVTTRRLRDVHVDPQAATATVGAGVVWREVIDAAAEYGLAPLNGSSSGVGVVGYTLGGGLPVMGRTFGFAADHVKSLDVVTLDGEFRHVDAQTEPDLFWGLCGGQGNLGIVTSMTFGLMPVSTIYGGGIFYTEEHIAAVWHAYRQWCPDLPETMTTSVAVLRLPPLPEIPEPLRGQTLAHLRVCFVGDAAEGARLLAPMRAVAPPMIDAVADIPYSAVDSIHQDPHDPVPAYQRGALLRELGADTVDALLAVAGAGVRTPVLLCEVRQLGGALRRAPEGGNAVGARRGEFSLSAVAVLAPPIAQVAPAAVDALVAALRTWGTGGTFVNMHGSLGDEADRARAWDEATYSRLLELSRRYDPAGLLRSGHVIGRTPGAREFVTPPRQQDRPTDDLR